MTDATSPLLAGTAGKILYDPVGDGQVQARARFREFDRQIRLVSIHAWSRAAAERALKAALPDSGDQSLGVDKRVRVLPVGSHAVVRTQAQPAVRSQLLKHGDAFSTFASRSSPWTTRAGPVAHGTLGDRAGKHRVADGCCCPNPELDCFTGASNSVNAAADAADGF